jgi:hypothetical protein
VKYGPIWFEEENTVLPWVARGNGDRKRLKAAGLGPQNFPLLRPNSAMPHQPAVPTPQQEKSAEEEDTTLSAEEVDMLQKETSPEPLSPSGPVPQQESTSMANDQYEQGVEMVDDSPTDTKPAKVRSSRPRRRNVLVINTRTTPAGSIIDRVRAASNVFGKDLVTLNLGDQYFTVSRAALEEHCGVLKDQDEEELDFGATSPLIVPAFINAISPIPSKGLPQHDFKFKKQNHQQGLNSEDVLGVMNTDNVKVTKINWDVESLIEIHRLSVSFDCPIVQNMVVDEMRQLYLKCVKAEKVSAFHLPSFFLNELESGVDEPLLRLGADILRDQCKKLDRSLPDDLGDHVLEHIERRGVADSHVLDSGPHAARCAHYHLHDENEPCYKVRTHKGLDNAREDIKKAWDFTSSIYNGIKKAATDTHNHVMSAIERRSTNPDQDKERQQKRRELVEWSQEHEEKMVRFLLQLEMMQQVKAETLAKGKTLDTNFKETERRLCNNASNFRNYHCAAWNCYKGVHMHSCERYHKQKPAYSIGLLDGKFVTKPVPVQRCWGDYWA